MKRNESKNKGITLIALVITIIILLILAGISINALTGSNGLFARAKDAKNKTIEAQKQENKLIDNYIAELNDMSGTQTESYIGCYADMDGNGTVDGIIYADLAHNKSGVWNEDTNKSNYAYTAKTNLKSYYIKEADHSQKWGTGTETITADVISPIEGTTGNDRFYVMALEDFKQGAYNYFYWYYNSYDKASLDRKVDYGYNDFGQGKTNTINMLNYWNNKTYGEQTTSTSGKSYIDLWGAIQDNQYSLVQNENDSVKWFIPSKTEWSAFGDYLYTRLNVDSNYSNFGLSDWYWSSSQFDTTGYAFCADFSYGNIGGNVVYGGLYVRLSATF